MSDVRVVSFDGLRSRLRSALGEESKLFEQFDEALEKQDDELVNKVMESLNYYPPATRKLVQDELLAWLFDPSDASGLAHLETAGSLPN